MDFRRSKRKYTTITIPSALFSKVKERIEGTGFSSVSDYVTYILRETITDMEISKNKGRKADDVTVIERLKALGYINNDK